MRFGYFAMQKRLFSILGDTLRSNVRNRTAYLLDGIQRNERCNNRLIVSAKEESLIVLVYDRGRIDMKRGLVVNGNPPEFFDLVGKVFAVEEMNHPVATLITAFQEEELAPLMVIQLHYVERGCGGTEISETDG